MDNKSEQVPAGQVALQELEQEVHGPEDAKLLQEWTDEYHRERAQAVADLGKQTTELVVTRDGSIATPDEVSTAQEHGQDLSGPYAGGTRA
jgi:signal transduction protein with GAF and PtsI domain